MSRLFQRMCLHVSNTHKEEMDVLARIQRLVVGVVGKRIVYKGSEA